MLHGCPWILHSSSSSSRHLIRERGGAGKPAVLLWMGCLWEEVRYGIREALKTLVDPIRRAKTILKIKYIMFQILSIGLIRKLHDNVSRVVPFKKNHVQQQGTEDGSKLENSHLKYIPEQ